MIGIEGLQPNGKKKSFNQIKTCPKKLCTLRRKGFFQVSQFRRRCGLWLHAFLHVRVDTNLQGESCTQRVFPRSHLSIRLQCFLPSRPMWKNKAPFQLRRHLGQQSEETPASGMGRGGRKMDGSAPCSVLTGSCSIGKPERKGFSFMHYSSKGNAF